jgi:uncharacterized protein YggU (UPF0235/DUF167 family)
VTIALEQHPEGTVLLVRAQAGARRSGLRPMAGGALKVSVTQVAEKGKANQALVAVMSRSLGLRPWQFELVSGVTVANKRFLVRGVTPAELAARLAEALSGQA